jgi:Domain of unknown function (DUF4440)
MISAPAPFWKERSLSTVRDAFPLLLLALLAPAAGADRSLAADEVAQLRQVESRRQQACIDADVPVLEVILGDELRYVHANGRVVSKRELVDSIASGQVDYVSIRTPEAEVHVYGMAAVVAGSAALEVRAGGGPLQKLTNLFAAVYALRDGSWRLVAYQSTPAAGGS